MPQASPNYYALLGVAPDADRKAIRARYVALMQRQRMHPDLGGAHDAAAQLTEAYLVLRDPVRRKLYDRLAAHVMASTVTGSAAPAAAERRHERRTAYQGGLQILSQSGLQRASPGQCRDVSPHGCSFRTVRAVQRGELVCVVFEIDPDRQFAGTVQWVRAQPQRFGATLYDGGVQFQPAESARFVQWLKRNDILKEP